MAFEPKLFTMISLHRAAIAKISHLHRLSTISRNLSSHSHGNRRGGEEDSKKEEFGEWNTAWETAWLPDDLPDESRPGWEADVNYGIGDVVEPPEQVEAREFMEEMDQKWSERMGKKTPEESKDRVKELVTIGKLDDLKKDYRLKKQRIHASLWTKEIEKIEESRFTADCDDIERLMNSCSDIFDNDVGGFENLKPQTIESEFKSKPEGWESTSKIESEANVWEMTQREEDILLQEFDRRLAFSKYKIACFVKQHIFSRRRPIDGWKYMIEELGPNAKRGKEGSIARMASMDDSTTRPFKEASIRTIQSYPTNS